MGKKTEYVGHREHARGTLLREQEQWYLIREHACLAVIAVSSNSLKYLGKRKSRAGTRDASLHYSQLRRIPYAWCGLCALQPLVDPSYTHSSCLP